MMLTTEVKDNGDDPGSDGDRRAAVDDDAWQMECNGEGHAVARLQSGGGEAGAQEQHSGGSWAQRRTIIAI
ncbi:hypothetical protein E2562_007787 [Oryza meyeriana var. granulata]|uniref:Uncharacterized protein n=1 Tax=Oryza meyeriana var. granulata TaxID=110450 RepID=A0A6G1EFW3_9ORYZ|nr:hypothetical protein E2562_007787 [Oryza meyeriana var. granulata]